MPLSSLLPGPHDPYNASSVKLAEATRIRLVLPGLSAPEKDEPTLLNRANSSKLQAEAAAAKEKTRKKLLKLQGIASQADKAQSAVIVDAVVLESEEDTDGDEASCSSTEQGSEAVAGSGAVAGNHSKRTSRQGNAPTAGQHNSNYSPTTGWGGGGEGIPGRSKKPGFRSSGDGAKTSSRLSVPSPRVTSDNEATSAGFCAASTRAAAGSSGKPYVPIWDRLPSTPAEEKRPQATTQRVLQPVAIKTFSPTLGSLGQNINPDATYRPPGQEAVPLRSAASGRIRKSTTPAASDQPRFDNSSQSNRAGGAVASELQGLRNKSKSFTAGHYNPNQLL